MFLTFSELTSALGTEGTMPGAQNILKNKMFKSILKLEENPDYNENEYIIMNLVWITFIFIYVFA